MLIVNQMKHGIKLIVRAENKTKDLGNKPDATQLVSTRFANWNVLFWLAIGVQSACTTIRHVHPPIAAHLRWHNRPRTVERWCSWLRQVDVDVVDDDDDDDATELLAATQVCRIVVVVASVVLVSHFTVICSCWRCNTCFSYTHATYIF